MVDGRPHEFVSDAHKRNFEKNLGEDVREIVFTFDVTWNRNRSVTHGAYPSLSNINVFHLGFQACVLHALCMNSKTMWLSARGGRLE